MDITVGLFIAIVLMAFVAEFIDASLGMGYGTMLSPLLIIIGFDPVVAVPPLLLSQAAGGLTASIFHQRLENVSYQPGSRSFVVVGVVSGLGVLATIVAALSALKIPSVYMKSYIGLLVSAMGVILFMRRRFAFSWWKVMGIGLLSAFNKGLSGGGFGPVVTGGQVIAGEEHKPAIGATTLAEVPICLVATLTYVVGKASAHSGIPILRLELADVTSLLGSGEIFAWDLLAALALGAVLAAPFGALFTQRLKGDRMRLGMAGLVTVLGLWTLYSVLG